MIGVEIHVRRNMLSITRPTVVIWNTDKGMSELLQPGSTEYPGRIRAVLSVPVSIDRYWLSFVSYLQVDGVKLTEPRPGVLFAQRCDIPTVVHFPSVAPPDDPLFGGWFTLCTRIPT